MSTIDDRWIREGQSGRMQLEGGIGLYSKAGAISDADLDTEALDNVIGGVDTATGRVYVKVAGTWQYLGFGARPRCKITTAAAMRIDTAFTVAVPWDTTSYDNATFFSGAGSAIAGTVQKTGNSNAVVGTGTSFLTALAVGDTIKISGGSDDVSTVATITDNTHLTMASTAGSSNSAQTLTKTNTKIVMPEDGFYTISATLSFASNATGARAVLIKKNGSSTIAQQQLPTSTTSTTIIQAKTEDEFDAGEYVTVSALQTAGSQIQLLQASYAPMVRVSKKDVL